MRISLIQADQAWEDKDANIANYDAVIDELQETDLILLPEMFHTGFTMNTSELAETMEKGPGLQWLKKKAHQKNAAIYTSLIIEDDTACYNRGLFVEPDGAVTVYDKRKCFSLAGENKFFKPGTKETIVHYKGWNIQLQICYDLRFPEIVRNREIEPGKANYDLILYVANWPSKRRHHWNTLLTARAIENQCYVAAVNRVGTDGKGLEYSGDSQIVDALGNSSQLNSPNQSAQTFVIKLTELKMIRENLPFLRDREEFN